MRTSLTLQGPAQEEQPAAACSASALDPQIGGCGLQDASWRAAEQSHALERRRRDPERKALGPSWAQPRDASGSTPESHSPKQQVTAACPDGLVALSGGASVRNAINRQGVGLQVARVDALGHLFRAHAQEHPYIDYPHEWGLTSIALCAERPSRFDVTDSEFNGPSSAQFQYSTVYCEDDRNLVSHGAAIDANEAVGYATLQSIGNGNGSVTATEQADTPATWGDVLARGVCAEIEWE